MKSLLTFCISLIFWSLYAVQAFAQNPASIHFEPNSINLPFASVFGEIMEDSLGILWLGTESGLYSYDGTTFTLAPKEETINSPYVINSFMLPNDIILGQNSSDHIVIKHSNDDTLRNFIPVDSLKNLNCQLLDHHKNKIVFSAKKTQSSRIAYIYSYDFDRHLLLLQSTIDYLEERNGSPLVFYSHSGDLFCVKDDYKDKSIDSIYSVDSKFRLEKSIKSNNIFFTGVNPKFLKTKDYFIIPRKVSFRNMQISDINQPSLLLRNENLSKFPQINHILLDKLGEQWASFEEGLIGLDSQLIPVKNKLYFKGEFINSLMQDKRQNYWLGTGGDGLHFIPNINTRIFNQNNSILDDDEIKFIKKWKNHILIILESGSVYNFHDNELKLVGQHADLGKTSMVVNKNNEEFIYVHEDKNAPTKLVEIEVNGVPFINNLTKSIHSLKLFDTESGNIQFIKKALDFRTPEVNTIRNFVYDSTSNKLYFSTMLGTFKEQKKNTQNQNELNKISPKSSIVILKDKFSSNIWLEERNKLSNYRINQKTAKHSFVKSYNIKARKIIQTKDSSIWVLSNNDGVFRIKNDSVYEHLTTENGLLWDFNKIMHEDGDSTIFIGGTRGITAYNFYNNRLSYYTKKDGLFSSTINAIETTKDHLLVGTKVGLYSLDLKKNKEEFTEYPIITDVQIWGKSVEHLEKKLSLKNKENNLLIKFRSNSIGSLGLSKFEYRIIGIDSIWQQIPNKQNELRVPQLSPGQYKFQVRITDEINKNNYSKIAEIAIKLNPPYWQKWWFLLSSGIFIFTLTGLYFNQRANRKQQQIQKENELERKIQYLKADALKSQMNPHFIFNALNAIQLFFIKNDQESAMKYLTKFSKLIRFNFDNANMEAIALSSEIQFLKTYLELEALRFDNKVSISVDIEEHLEDSQHLIPPLLIQPIIENSFKHGLLHKKEKGSFKLQISEQEGYVLIQIIDNGIGIEQTKKQQANGNTHKRNSTDVINERIKLFNQLNNAQISMHTENLKDQNPNTEGTITTFKIYLANHD